MLQFIQKGFVCYIIIGTIENEWLQEGQQNDGVKSKVQDR